MADVAPEIRTLVDVPTDQIETQVAQSAERFVENADRICRGAVRNAHELGIGSSRLALHASVCLTPSGHAILIDRQLGYTWWGSTVGFSASGAR